MAVYTALGPERLAELIHAYDVGTFVSAEEIAEGISNSNWVITTTRGRFVLTVYERRIDTADLPFFLGLLDHLSLKGCAVPRTIHDRQGDAWRHIEGKAAALIEFLPGSSPASPSGAQARAAGQALARVHLAAQDFALKRANRLDAAESARILTECGEKALAKIDPQLAGVISIAANVASTCPADLPGSAIHTDLFPDNVLMIGDKVTGLIDFYFACTGPMAYDLAVTHAAWCFDKSGRLFDPDLGRALIAGYEAERPLTADERAAMRALAQAACMRFVASRAQDWLEAPAGTGVQRKDPLDFFRRWQFYAQSGAEAFA